MESTQGEAPEAEDRFDNSEDGLYSLLSEFVFGFGVLRFQFGFHVDPPRFVDRSLRLGNYVTDGKSNQTSYTYDNFNRLIKTCYPPFLNGVALSTPNCEQQGYTGGRVTSVTLRDNQVVNFGYDALGRVSTKSGAVVESFVYDNFNQVIYHSNSTTGGAVAASTYTYNSLGWLLSNQQPIGTVSYEYDGLGRRTKMTYPGSGLYVSYVYTELSELSRICENISSTDCSTAATPLIRFAYDSNGRRSHLYRANGQTTTYSYDTASRLLGITTPGNTLTYAYSVADQVKSRENSVTSFDLPAPATGTTNYTPNVLNQIGFVGSIKMFHDMRGNMTGDSGGDYVYNANNLMTSATLSTQPVSLTYDAENRLARVERTGYVTTRFLYDGADVIAEYNDAGTTVLRRYVHGPGSDEALVWYEGATTATKYFLHADQLGSITQITNADGTSNTIYAYDDYGVRSPKSGTLNSRYAYTGQMYLPEIGMYYYKARMYNPVLGRFMQTDPIGYGDGMNWYAYVRNDPVNHTDPMGLDCRSEQAASGAAVSCGDKSGPDTGLGSTYDYMNFLNGLMEFWRATTPLASMDVANGFAYATCGTMVYTVGGASTYVFGSNAQTGFFAGRGPDGKYREGPLLGGALGEIGMNLGVGGSATYVFGTSDNVQGHSHQANIQMPYPGVSVSVGETLSNERDIVPFDGVGFFSVNVGIGPWKSFSYSRNFTNTWQNDGRMSFITRAAAWTTEQAIKAGVIGTNCAVN